MTHRTRFLPIFALLLWASVMAHPAHVSMAEMEWDATSKIFEVSLKIAPDDLELALSQALGRRISLPGTQQLDELLRDLLTARFTIRPETGKPLALHWIGHEISPRAVWLYFEFRPDPGQNAFDLSNRLLLEVRAQQVNTVNFNLGKQRQTFRFSRDDVEARLLLPDASGTD